MEMDGGSMKVIWMIFHVYKLDCLSIMGCFDVEQLLIINKMIFRVGALFSGSWQVNQRIYSLSVLQYFKR